MDNKKSNNDFTEVRSVGRVGSVGRVIKVGRFAVGHFVVGRFTVFIVEQLPQAATAAFPQRL